jgi:plasmid replication initiation protein
MESSRLIVTKGNALIEATYRLTLAEQRLLLLVISKIDSRSGSTTAETEIVVTAKELSEVYQLDDKEGYATLKDVAERLFSRAVIIERPDPDHPSTDRTRTRWVSAIDYAGKDGCLSLYLAPKVIPYLTQLAREFTTYRLRHVSAMRSIHAVRLYEMLAQWRDKGTLQIAVETLKARLGVAVQYRRMYDFKQWVIRPAIEQINAHSDLWVKWDQRKRGRVVEALIFTFGSKAEQKPETKPPSLPKPAKPKLTRAYIERHAQPGESWEEATERCRRKLEQENAGP